MPFVRIDVSKDLSADVVERISLVIYDSMTEVANVPPNDKFQVITRHTADELVYPADGYLGIDYTPNIVFIQVTWNAGRSIEVKKAFFKAVAEGIHQATGIRIQDVWISLVDVQRENWSFGNGEMQYAPKD
jgi:4-oxalocrotonate tautomerase